MSGALEITADQQWWTSEQLDALQSLAGGADNAPEPNTNDLRLLLHTSQRTGLDPFTRQLYLIHRGGKWAIQTSIDGLRIVAQRTNQYAGQEGPLWCAPDKVWMDVWLADAAPAAAKVGVWRQGFAAPLWRVATWKEYGGNGPMWRKMGAHMLAKCAEANGMRSAFPQDLSGLYVPEEFDGDAVPERQVDKPRDVDPNLTAADLMDRAEQAATHDVLQEIYRDARTLELLEAVVAHPDGEDQTLQDYIVVRGKAVAKKAAEANDR